MAANAEVPPVARKTRKHIGGDDADAEGWQEGPGRRDRRMSALLGTRARREENTSAKLTMRGRSASKPTSPLIARLKSSTLCTIRSCFARGLRMREFEGWVRSV